MLFPGSPGVARAVGLLALVWLIIYLAGKGQPIVFDPGGKHGVFGKRLLPTYLDITKFVLDLAAGSIVRLVGSLNFNQSGRSLKPFASPLLLVAHQHPLRGVVDDYASFELRTSFTSSEFLYSFPIHAKPITRIRLAPLFLYQLHLADRRRDQMKARNRPTFSATALQLQREK
jgi:hypothetical protein